MGRTCLSLISLLAIVISLVMSPISQAAGLTLTHLGGLATNGAKYSEWWYSGTTPLLKGTAANGAEVSITIDSDEKTVTADSSGYWSYQTSLTAKDYKIVVASGSESYTFTLHAGQNMSASGSASETTQSTISVPPTGYNQVAGIFAGLTLAAAGFYAYLQGRKNTKKAYAGEVIKSLEE